MSKYTTEIRYLCESVANMTEGEGNRSVTQNIKLACPLIFNFDFPIFDEEYREELEIKILRHYYTREICEETVGLWKLRMETKLNEIMPYYNQLYKSALHELDPFINYEMERIGSSNDVSTKTNNETTNVDTTRTNNLASGEHSHHYDLYSDTPQGGLQGVNSEQYLTNARKITDDVNTTNTGTIADVGSYVTNGSNDGTNKKDYIERITGLKTNKSKSELLNEFRETFLNIDMMIIDELSGLFFNLW